MSTQAHTRSWFGTTLKVLLVDEDPLFRSRMQRAAAAKGWALTAHARLSDVDWNQAAKEYDVLVLNYYADDVRHRRSGEAGPSLERLPAVLVSNFTAAKEDGSSWPAPTKCFARKADGCDAILDAALDVSHGKGVGGALLGKIRGALKR
jgi:hypothetical protein